MNDNKLLEALADDVKPIEDLLVLLRDGDVWPRLVGGHVRDRMLGKNSSDIDIATALTPGQVLSRLEARGIPAIPTGIAHGTITCIYKGRSLEITTLRQDVNCDGRHAQVKFSKDFMQDALRRDFTINALSYAPDHGKIYDYVEGLAHLKEKRVVFIGDANARIREDALRIMRFYRFSALYAEAMDQAGYSATIEHKNSLSILSRERIIYEFNRLVIAPKAIEVLQFMKQGGVLDALFTIPVDVSVLAEGFVIAKSLQINPSIECLYAMLFRSAKTQELSELLSYNRFSRMSKNRILSYTNYLGSIGTKDAISELKSNWLAYPDDFEQYLMFSALIGVISIETALELKADLALRPSTLPVRGGDLQAIGYQGIEIKQALDTLKHLWINSNFELSKEQLLNLLGNPPKKS